DYLGKGAFAAIDEITARDILREVERFASQEWAASFVVADRQPPALRDGEVGLPEELRQSLSALREAGWDRLGVGSELGGAGAPPSLFWATQELLLGANATAAFYASGPLFALVIYEEGSSEQRDLARLMVDRGWAGTMALTEPDAGSDVGAGTTRATHVEGPTWHLEGVKRFITGGEHDGAENIVHLVLARPEGGPPGTKGLSLFIVPKHLVGVDGSIGERNGVVATKVEDKMGLKGSATCELTFGMDRPAVGYLLGDAHDGIRQMFRVIEHARMIIGTKSAATLSTGYLHALDYARERAQGPDLTQSRDPQAARVPIIRHPDVRRMLMLQKAHAEGLRALVTYTAWVQDQALLHPEDDRWARRGELLLPLVKGYASEKAYELLSQSLQVLGGSGYLRDYPIEQYLRDAKVDTVYEGTTGIQALDLVFRKVARNRGETLTVMASEIAEFVKRGSSSDRLGDERELLGVLLEDAQAHLGSMVGHLMASQERPAEVHKVGLQANALLETLAEVVIAWQLLRHAEVALTAADWGGG
ncbi:MAG: acyl-CoA dehydrogenase, partial [Acidimicrobiia bacterium]